MNRPLATAVVLSEGEVESNKNFALAKGGSISGIVRPSPGVGVGIEGVAITVYEQNWGTVAGENTTDADGKYSVGNLPAGRYYVSADGHSVGYSAEYYNNQPMTEEGKALATLVTVSPGSVGASTDFDLAPLTSISGTVTDDSVPANPLPDALVEVIDAHTLETVASNRAAGGGVYEVLVEPGDYYVSAVAAGHAREYFEEESDIAEAQVLSPGAGAPLTDVNFTLMPVGIIRTVSDVQSAPFTLGLVIGPAPIVGNTGPERVWESGELVAAIWRIVWGAVPGYTAPLPETETLDPGEILTLFGHYTLEEGFRVNKVSKSITGDPERVRIEW
jgi:hypothetical protein